MTKKKKMKKRKTDKLHKLKSAKLWVTIWAMFFVGYIIISRQPEFTSVATILSAAPLVYCGCNVLQKRIENDAKEPADEL